MFGLVMFSAGLLTLIFGLKNDDVRILFGGLMVILALVGMQKDYDTYLCEGSVGVQRAQYQGHKRWTLSDGKAYHSQDFYAKCREVAPPGADNLEVPSLEHYLHLLLSE